MVLKLEKVDYFVLELVMEVQVWSWANHNSLSGASSTGPVSVVHFANCPLSLALINGATIQGQDQFEFLLCDCC